MARSAGNGYSSTTGTIPPGDRRSERTPRSSVASRTAKSAAPPLLHGEESQPRLRDVGAKHTRPASQLAEQQGRQRSHPRAPWLKKRNRRKSSERHDEHRKRG